MAQFLITGGKRLSGEITISGNKNSVLPLLAATLLTDQEVTLENVPHISDVSVFVEILQSLGAKVQFVDHIIKVEAKDITTHIIPGNLARKLRASILFVGPLLARIGKAEFPHPGGDLIGIRSIEAHLEGLQMLGAEVKKNDLEYKVSLKRNNNDLEIFLDEPSVTATENLLMTVALGKNKIILKNCASEPHIIDLCQLLEKMGVQIEGIGTSTLTIKANDELKGAEFKIGFDYMELGTYAVAAAITKGEIYLKNCSLKDMEPVTHPLSKMGVIFEDTSRGIKTYGKDLQAISHLKPNHWPGFPTDLMSVMVVLATQAQGMSLLHDWMYESRMFFVDKLISMGAKITIADPHRVLVYGPTSLNGRFLETPDIRAGMALVLAALIAEGESTINRIELIERGYDNVVENLCSLGADVKRVD